MTMLPAPATVDVQQRKMGRLYAADPRDLNYTVEAKLRTMTRAELKRRTQAPHRAATLDQGATPRCTMFALAHVLGASAMRHGGKPLAQLEVPLDGHADCYAYSQNNDEFPGANYDGTSVRAALKYAQARNLITSYYWARDLEEAKDFVGRAGSAPMEAGVDWFAGMSNPKKVKGRFVAEPNGDLEGGHAFCVLWHLRKEKLWKIQNSWSESYGDRGIAYIEDAVLDYLVFQANGELGAVTEAR